MQRLSRISLAFLAIGTAAAQTVNVVVTNRTAGYVQSLKYKGAYSAYTTYSANDVVSSGSALYLSLANSNLSNTPGSASQWMLIGSGSSGGSGSAPTVTNNSLAASNVYVGLSLVQHVAMVSKDQQACGSNGDGCNAENQPFGSVNTISKRYPGTVFVNSWNDVTNFLSGGENSENFGVNIQSHQWTLNQYAPAQLGGTNSMFVTSVSQGDTVGEADVILGWASGRNEDEGLKARRNALAFKNPDAGGVLSSITTTDPTGHVPVHLNAVTNSAGNFNVQWFGEQNLVADVSKITTLPDMASNTSTGSNNEFVQIAFAAPHGLGLTTSTTLTQPVDAQVYSGTCPAHTATGNWFPTTGPDYGAHDAWATEKDGTGVQGINGNYDPGTGALTGFCFTVGSTAGMSVGTEVFLAHQNFDQEFTKVLTVPDAHHFTAFVHHNHDVGTTAAWGGAIGKAVGLGADVRPAGFSSSVQNPQNAEMRLVYPIIGVPDATHVNVFTRSASSNAEMRTLAYGGNTIYRPIVFDNVAVTSGVLTAFRVDGIYGSVPNNYVISPCGTGGVCNPLPPPVLTFGGANQCTTNPTFSWRLRNNQNTYNYVPTLTDGGEGCPSNLTITAASTVPNPAYAVPVALIDKVIDPTQVDGNGHPVVGTGNILLSAVPSAFAVGDTLEMTMDSARYYGDQEIITADPVVNHSGKNGDWMTKTDAFLQSGSPAETRLMTTPSSWFFGTFANKWLPSNSMEASMAANPWKRLYGIYGGFERWLPAVAQMGHGLSSADGTAPYIGGYEFTIHCTDGLGHADHPCLHGQYPLDGIFNFDYGANSHMEWDPVSGTLRWSHTIQAPGFQLTSAPGKPCSATQNNGTFNYIAGGTGVKDIMQACMKDASENWAWRSVTTF